MQCRNFSIHNKFDKDICFFVDLDGTLVHTDKANSLAYQQAVLSVVGMHINIDGRITGKILKRLLNCDNETFKKIVWKKKLLYPKFLHHTVVNQNLLHFLFTMKANYPIYLVTRSEEKRAKETIMFHHLRSVFTDTFYCKQTSNKWRYAMSLLNVSPEQVIIFDDNEIEIQNAISEKIPSDNIYHIIL